MSEGCDAEFVIDGTLLDGFEFESGECEVEGG